MRAFLLLLFALGVAAPAMAQLVDDFSDGDFTNNPVWMGDVSKFEVTAAYQLRLNAPAVTDTAYLSTVSTAALDCEWFFFFRLDFAPSNSNYLKVYLMADQQNLKLPLNGYFIRAGKDGSDDRLQLYKQQGTTETLLIDGIAGNVAANNNTVSVKVTRDATGTFHLYADNTGGTNYIWEGSATDLAITTSQYFGFFCKYTSTRSDKFYFDNVYAGPPLVDTLPPMIEAVEVLTPSRLRVTFSEAVEASSAQTPNHYWLDEPAYIALSAVLYDAAMRIVVLDFPFLISNGTHTLYAAHIQDLQANTVSLTSATFQFYQALPGDLLINEIMADPTPALGLPAAEFIELVNVANYPIDLKGWKLSDRSNTIELPTKWVAPGEFVIVCDADFAQQFAGYGPVVAHASFPSLNNDGDSLTLTEPFGTVVEQVIYADDWYQLSPKPDGGISLERISLQNTCSGPHNWHGSLDPAGGTPGASNSVSNVLADTAAPQVMSAYFLDGQRIVVLFNEPLDTLLALTPATYLLTADPLPPIPVQSVTLSPNRQECTLHIAYPADSNRLYKLMVGVLSDCNGNISEPNTVLLALASVPKPGQLVINEILFNPAPGGSDYVELYNTSDRIFDLSMLRLARVNDFDSVTSHYAASNHTFLLLPDQYVVCTEDRAWLLEHYYSPFPDNILETNLPTFPDDKGTVAVLYQSQRIDQFHYSDKWHHPLIDNTEGVALERISPLAPTQDSMNWHSAAASVGFGTPAYRNSQFVLIDIGDAISLSPQVISPDQDGFNDFLVISYSFAQPGNIMNLWILDATGRPVIHLVKNALMDQQGFFTWDGVGSDGRKARMGHYILVAEVFDLTGKVRRTKKVFSVAARAN